MKRWKIPLIAAMAITTPFLMIGLLHVATPSPTFIKSRATPAEYTLTLNDSNSPEIVDSTSADKDINEYISFHYEGTSLSVASGRHIRMGSGKFYNTKQIREITNIKVTAPVNTDNLLVLYVGYTLDDIIAEKYAYSIIGTSQVSIDTKCNYFGLYSSKTYGISNVTITYSCPSDSSKPEAPTDLDTQKLVYGGSNKKLVIDNGAGTFKDAQTVVTNADGLQYNYKYATFSVEFKFPTSVINSTTDFNFGLQAQKYMNADGGPSAAFQFGITNFSTSAWALKVSGTSRDSGTLATPLAADTWYEFKVEITTGSTYNLKCYIDDELISNTQRGSLGKNLYTYGMRFGNGSLGEISFKNMSLTGHN